MSSRIWMHAGVRPGMHLSARGVLCRPEGSHDFWFPFSGYHNSINQAVVGEDDSATEGRECLFSVTVAAAHTIRVLNNAVSTFLSNGLAGVSGNLYSDMPSFLQDVEAKHKLCLRRGRHEEHVKASVAGRGRPGPDGIRTAPGFGCSGGYCNDADPSERDQQRVQQFGEQPFKLVSRWSGTSAFVGPVRVH